MLVGLVILTIVAYVAHFTSSTRPSGAVEAPALDHGKYGQLSAGGAVRGRYVLDGDCVAFELPALAASPGAKTRGLTVLTAGMGAGRYALFTVIDEDAGRPTHGRLALATTRTINAQFSIASPSQPNAGRIWEAGWWRIQAQGEPFGHYGRGRLTIMSSGRSGKIAASLTEQDGHHHSTVTVPGSWVCHHVRQAA